MPPRSPDASGTTARGPRAGAAFRTDSFPHETLCQLASTDVQELSDPLNLHLAQGSSILPAQTQALDRQIPNRLDLLTRPNDASGVLAHAPRILDGVFSCSASGVASDSPPDAWSRTDGDANRPSAPLQALLERGEKRFLSAISLCKDALAASQIAPQHGLTRRAPVGGCIAAVGTLLLSIGCGSRGNGRDEHQQTGSQRPEHLRITAWVMLDDDAGAGAIGSIRSATAASSGSVIQISADRVGGVRR